MTSTVIPFGDPRAQKRWSALLSVEAMKRSYFTRKFVREEANSIIQRKTELESDAGDRVSFDLSVMLRNKPTTGDNRVKGKEENLRFFTDEVIIDQARHAVSAGGKMSRKRTVHDIRKVARDRLSDYWSQYIDELHFMYLSGARGINQDFIEPTDFTGHAGNALQAPDSNHILFGGSATSKATITSSDKMSRALTSYARVAVARSGSGWTVTANSVSPAAAISFPKCTGGSSTVTHFAIGTAASGAGKVLYKGAVSPNIAVATNVTPQLDTASTVTED